MLAETINVVQISHFDPQKNINSQWDAYVQEHAQGSVFHLSGWEEVLKQSFGHACYSLVATEDEQIVGILPLFEVKSRLFSHALISSPMCVYAGALADSDEIARMLEQRAVELADSLKVDYLELRYKDKQVSDLPCLSKHACFEQEISDDPQALLLSIKKKQRAVIRHSLNNQLTQQKGDIDSFYQLLSLSYKSLGTPVFSKKYFNLLDKTFGQYCDISLIKDQNSIDQCAVLSFFYKDKVLPYYAGTTLEARQLKAMDFMYFKLMLSSAEQGKSIFDFGRSKKQSGAFNYKKNWGMEAQPLFYYFHLVKAKALPDNSPTNPKYRLFIKLWKRLPLKVSQVLGAFISKGLG